LASASLLAILAAATCASLGASGPPLAALASVSSWRTLGQHCGSKPPLMAPAGFIILPNIIPIFDLHSLTLHSLKPALLMPKKFQMVPPPAGAGVATTAGVATAAPPGGGPAGTWAQTPDVIPTMVATLKLIFHIFMTFPFGSRAAIGLPAISLASNSAVKAGYLEEY